MWLQIFLLGVTNHFTYGVNSLPTNVQQWSVVHMLYCSDCDISQGKTKQPSCYEDGVLFWFISMVRHHSLSRQLVPQFFLMFSLNLCCFKLFPESGSIMSWTFQGDPVCTSRQSAILELSVPNLAVAPESREAWAHWTAWPQQDVSQFLKKFHC